jgi:1-deoxy-D-xylulose-5-phosphate synthase
LNRQEGHNWSDISGEKVVYCAARDERIVAITAAMTDGTGLADFAKKFPNRFFDVGIAEQHAVTSAAGLALGGMRPFVFCYSSFLQRAYDQLLMDVALQKLPIIFMVDRAGCVGQDGETHHGLFDLSYLGHMPNMTIYAPASEAALRLAIEEALASGDGPVAIRYPRGVPRPLPQSLSHNESAAPYDIASIDLNVFQTLREGSDVSIISIGGMTSVAIDAAEILAKCGIDAGVIDVFKLKPLDEKRLSAIFAGGKPIVTLEDNVFSGGFGEKVAAFAETHNYTNRIHIISWPDKFIAHGSVTDLAKSECLDAEGIAESIRTFKETAGFN